MNLLLCLSALLCLATANAIDYDYGTGFRSISFSSGYHDDFYVLCPGEEFQYNGLTVNSVLTIRANQDTENLEGYAMESVDYQRLFKKSDAKQLAAIQNDYHKRLTEMYGKDYLNDPSYQENVMHKKLAALRTKVISFWGKGKNPFLADTTLGKQINKTEKAQNFSQILHAYRTRRTPAVSELVRAMFGEHLGNTALGVDNATMAFAKEKLDLVFFKGIYQFDRFEPVNASEIFDNSDWKKDYGKVHFKMQVPFEQHGSKLVVPSRPCLKANQLPVFYQTKGKPGH